MHSSAIFQAPPIALVFYCPCDKVYHKQYLQGQKITWQKIIILWIKIDHVLL